MSQEHGKPVMVHMDTDQPERHMERAALITATTRSDAFVYCVSESSGQWINTADPDPIFTVHPCDWTPEHQAIADKYSIEEGEPEVLAKVPA